MKQIPALGWPGRPGVPGHLAVMPSLAAGTDLSPAVPRGAQDKASPGPGWLLARDTELMLAGARCSDTERARARAGTARGATAARPAREGRSEKLPCCLSVCKIAQALFTTGCSRVFVHPGGSFGIA